MAAAEKIERGYLGKVLQPTLLKTAAVEAIVEGRQANETTLPEMIEGVAAIWRITCDKSTTCGFAGGRFLVETGPYLGIHAEVRT